MKMRSADRYTLIVRASRPLLETGNLVSLSGGHRPLEVSDDITYADFIPNLTCASEAIVVGRSTQKRVFLNRSEPRCLLIIRTPSSDGLGLYPDRRQFW
jgi:hypothetical protein